MQRWLVVFIIFFMLQPIYEVRADAWVDDRESIISTSHSSFAIQPNGSLWAWGNNEWGQLGDGTNVDRHTPVKIMDDAVSVISHNSVLTSYTLAVKRDNTLWIWGRHDFEQPEEEGIIDRYIPTKLLDDVVTVASNGRTIMAIRTDGNLWAAGSNHFGLLTEEPGSGNRNYFEKIMDNVAAITMGTNHALAIRDNGSLWAWGINRDGQLGDNTTVDRHVPIRIMNDVASVSACQAISAAIKNDGSLWVWGNVGLRIRRLLDLDSSDTNSPVGLHDAAHTVSLSSGHMLMISTDNNLYGIGNNGYGQLGNGTNNATSEWIRIMDDVDSVVTGRESVLAIDAGGCLWAWGDNERGRLGDNTTIDRPRPVQIMYRFMSMEHPVIVAEEVEDPVPTNQAESAPEPPFFDGSYEIEFPEIHIPEEITRTSDTQQTTTLLLIIGAYTIILILLIAIIISTYLLYSLNSRKARKNTF